MGLVSFGPSERKARRKAARIEKKRRKLKKKLTQVEKPVVRNNDNATGKKRKRKVHESAHIQFKRTNPAFYQLLLDQNLIRDDKIDFHNPDEAEIKYLERKLGLSESRSKKNQENSWKRFENDLLNDGFAPGLGSFLRNLGKDKGEMNKKEEEEENISSESSGVDIDKPKERTEELKVEGAQDAVFIPKSDIYGEQSSKSHKQDEIAHKLETNQRVKRRIKGLVNRLAESNTNPICTDIIALYRSESRHQVNIALTETILEILENENTLLKEFAKVFAALVSALTARLGLEIGSFILEETIKQFKKVHGEENKRSANIMVFICFLYIFGMISSRVIYDILNSLSESLTDFDVRVISNITDFSGAKLRSDDPMRMKTFIEELQNSYAKLEGKNSNAYVKFLLEKVYDLKNNKIRGNHIQESTKRLRKWLKLIREESEKANTQIDIGFEDLINADTLGRWWVVGGVWKGQEQKVEQLKMERTNSSGSKRTQIERVLAEAPYEIIEKARKQRMNTDLRVALFCVIMNSEDYIEAFQSLLAFNLSEKQEREIVPVIMRCCGSNKTYNPYFGYLGFRLCEYEGRFKFTFQLAFWDVFKQFEDLKSKRLINLAALLSHLMSSFSLSLSVLKVIEFDELKTGGLCFLNALFHHLLLDGGASRSATKHVLQVFLRLQKSKDFPTVSAGIELFFRHHLYKNHEDKSKQMLLKKRCKAIKSMFELVSSRSEDQGSEDISSL